jgi:hypothetical protein
VGSHNHAVLLVDLQQLPDHDDAGKGLHDVFAVVDDERLPIVTTYCEPSERASVYEIEDILLLTFGASNILSAGHLWLCR